MWLGGEEIRTVAYTIEYSPETEGHLRVLTARQCTLVFDTVDHQLEKEGVNPTSFSGGI
jgi:hypothetical protein